MKFFKNLALVHRAYERGLQEVHRTRAREDESTPAKFFCNQTEKSWSISATVALVAIFKNLLTELHAAWDTAMASGISRKCF